MKKKEKIRLDRLLVLRGIAKSRQRAQSMIMAGRVIVDSNRTDKPGTLVAKDAQIDLKGTEIPYVSRGGIKLEHALGYFRINPAGMTCLDAGASTGGFTDCLLQNNAEKVYAVDVGYGQFDLRLRNDPRVVLFERTNIRYITRNEIPVFFDLAVIDVSFISLRLVVPVVMNFVKPGGLILPLVKPQFEVGKGEVGKGGVVRDPLKHEKVIEDLVRYFTDAGLIFRGVTASPILGPKGNKEFFVLFGVR